ncbi:MAG: hypothetical protein HY716_03715 [Planctomycetes bacterium]|nr:hypothetical protein [Planctomycetota bacterium]
MEKTKLPSQLGQGVYVGAYTMKGDPPKGEAAAQYAEVQAAYAREAMDALSNQKVPASYRDFVREYFDSIKGER